MQNAVCSIRGPPVVIQRQVLALIITEKTEAKVPKKRIKSFSEDFTGEVTDEDMLAMQIFITPDDIVNIKPVVFLDDDGNPLEERDAMEYTLIVLRTALFQLTTDFMQTYGETQYGEEPSFLNNPPD